MLNIAKQIHAGWNTTGAKHELPEAEVIPAGTTANEKRRLENVTKKYTVMKEHSNIPLPGFTLHKTDRKNWGSADQSWLVIDPRGYLVRISNDNLEDILHVTGITEGLIQEKCVWAREDTQTKMILVPTSSPDYIAASENTALIEGKVSLKDVQIGDTVMLQSETTGIFMGVLSLYSTADSFTNDRKPQVFLRRQIIKLDSGPHYYYQADLKILKVIKKTDNPMTREESMAIMNNDIAKNKKVYFGNSPYVPSSGYHTSRGLIKLASTDAVPKVKMSLEEIDKPAALKLFKEAQKVVDSGMMMVEQHDGKLALIDFPYSFSSSSKVSVDEFEISYVSNFDDMCETFQMTEVKRNYYNRDTKELHALDKFAKFYKIVKHVKNNTYV